MSDKTDLKTGIVARAKEACMGGRVQVMEALEAGNVDTVLEQPDPGPALMGGCF